MVGKFPWALLFMPNDHFDPGLLKSGCYNKSFEHGIFFCLLVNIMSYWNRSAGASGLPANTQGPLMQGRFVLKLLPYDTHYPKSDSSGFSERFDLNGGLWVNKMVSMGEWRGHVQAYLKYKNGQNPHPLSIQQGAQLHQPFGAPPADLFGDPPDFTQDLTWLPMLRAGMWLHTDEIQDLLTGKADIMLQTGVWSWSHQQGRSRWTPLSEHVLTINQRANDLLLISASEELLGHILNEIFLQGHVWISGSLVSKSEYQAFIDSLDSHYGDDTLQAVKNRLLKWVSRPSFVKEPLWQAHLCFVLMTILNVLIYSVLQES